MYTENLINNIAEKTGIDISKFDMNELVMGMDVELEHGSDNDKTDVTDDDPIATFKIVMAHMYEMPNYYTKLKNMEKKENISEYARRMRELAGYAEGAEKKSLNTIQEGKSSFENGATFMAKDMMVSNETKKVPGDLDINGNPIPASLPTQSPVNEAEEKGDDFETHKFEQKTIEEGADDEELYNLNENTVIVLDFLNEDEDMSAIVNNDTIANEEKMTKEMINKALMDLGISPNAPMAKQNTMYSEGFSAVEFMIQMGDMMRAEQEAEATAGKIADWMDKFGYDFN